MYAPRLYQNPLPPRCIAGNIVQMPDGIVLHGSRSGRDRSLDLEFHATRGYAQSGPYYVDTDTGKAVYLGWHATLGDDAVSVHMRPDQYGWHAGLLYSTRWLGVEFAQAKEGQEITDGQVRAFVWWFRQVALSRWPEMECHMMSHSETRQGQLAGKTDPFRVGDARNDALRHRILAAF